MNQESIRYAASEILPRQFQWMLVPQYLEKYRYIAWWGGRAGTKSWSVARTLVLIGTQKKMRFLCAREIQNSIEESSKQAIEKAISDLSLDDYYVVGRARITGINGTEFIFRGLSKVTAGSIKSYEDIDVAWLEEAQSISADSWGLLVPTIRKPGSQIWVTFNPHSTTDIVYQFFLAGHPPNRSFVKKVNYRDIDFSPLKDLDGDELREIEEAMEHDRVNYPEMYRHRWLGEPAPDLGVLRVLPMTDLDRAVELYPRYAGDFGDDVPDLGLDVADLGSDMNALATRCGPLLHDLQVWRGSLTIGDTARRADTAVVQKSASALYYDAGGLGSGVRSFLVEMGPRPYRVQPVKFGDPVSKPDLKFDRFQTNKQAFFLKNAQMAWALKMRLQNTTRLANGEKVDPKNCFFINPTILEEPSTRHLLEELNQPTWKDDDGRKIRLTKAQDDESSPDMFDATCLAFARDSHRGLRLMK